MSADRLVLGPPAVTYVSEQDRAWAQALRAAATLPELRELCIAWGAWVTDALTIAVQMTNKDFGEFRSGLLQKTDSRRWAKRYGAIAMPERLFRISIFAQQFHAPFGTAAIRLAEHGPPEVRRWLAKLVKAA